MQRTSAQITWDRMLFLDVTNRDSGPNKSYWLVISTKINAFVTLLLIFFLFRFYKYQHLYAENIDKTGITASDFTIMIENVRSTDTKEDIKNYLKALIGERPDLWGYDFTARAKNGVMSKCEEKFMNILNRGTVDDDDDKDKIKEI